MITPSTAVMTPYFLKLSIVSISSMPSNLFPTHRWKVYICVRLSYCRLL